MEIFDLSIASGGQTWAMGKREMMRRSALRRKGTGLSLPGQHEAIITEGLFYDAQDVLDGKKKKLRTKLTVDDRIPLRGFLICPRCGRMLTGSGSRGRKEHYF